MNNKDNTSKRAVESERKRQRLFSKACEEFGKTGYKDLSMDSLAKAAGVSKGLIFAFYGSKKNLFEAVIEHRLGQVRAFTATRQRRSKDAIESLETAFRSGFLFTSEHPEMFKLFCVEAQRVVPELLAEHKQYWIQTFSDCLSEAKQQDLLRDDVDICTTGEAIYHQHKALLDEVFARQDSRAISTPLLDASLSMMLHGIRN